MIFGETCAKLCHVNGGELEQIQFLLGHASVLTTERYLGCKQNLEEPVNDRFGCLLSNSLDSRQGLKASPQSIFYIDQRTLADSSVLMCAITLSAALISQARLKFLFLQSATLHP
jgi:hypothetical protein